MEKFFDTMSGKQFCNDVKRMATALETMSEHLKKIASQQETTNDLLKRSNEISIKSNHP